MTKIFFTFVNYPRNAPLQEKAFDYQWSLRLKPTALERCRESVWSKSLDGHIRRTLPTVSSVLIPL